MLKINVSNPYTVNFLKVSDFSKNRNVLLPDGKLDVTINFFSELTH